MFGTMTVGSAAWGQVAAMVGLPLALVIAAGGALATSRSPRAGNCRPVRASI